MDDDPLLRDLGKQMLEDLGYRVHLEENGEKALEVYAGHRTRLHWCFLT